MTVTVSAPAKLNLTLEILAKREDGYHEIRSVIQTIDLCDRLTFDVNKDVKIQSDMPEWNEEQSLLVHLAPLLPCHQRTALHVSFQEQRQ